MSRLKVKGTLGRSNGGPLKPVVLIESDVSWLSVAQARRLAALLNAAADKALAQASERAVRGIQ